MRKKKKHRLLTDWKHWLGWVITTGVIVGIFHLLNVHLHMPLWYVLILLAIIAGVDVIKHKIGLQ